MFYEKKLNLKILFTIIILNITAIPVFSMPVQLNKSIMKLNTGMKLGLYLDYLEDKENKLTLDDVRNKKNESLWKASKKENPGFGFKNYVFWARFTIENTSGENIEFYLQQYYPLIDDLSIHVTEDNGKSFKIYEVGDLKKFNERPYEDRTFIIPMEMKAKSVKKFYLRYNTASSMNIFLRIWWPGAFLKNELSETRFLMMYYGIVIVMIIYNLFVYFFVRRLEYLYYVFFITFFLIFIMTQNGTAFQFLWPGSPAWANYCIPLSLCLLVIFALLFALKFMDTKKFDPLFHKIAVILLITVSVIFIICLFAPYRYSMISSAAATVCALTYGIVLGVRVSLKKQRTAYFFTMAWMIFLLGGLGYVLMTFGVFPLNFYTQWSIQIGSAMQLVLLSIALADRMNTMRRELKALNENLEGIVNERTEELNVAMENLKSANEELVIARDQLWGEMQLAKKIQTVLLPERPSIKGWEISAYMEPADEVGGDYYDILNISGKDWIVIGDVSGHGVPAGLIMMMVQTSIHIALDHNPNFPPSELLTLINKTVAHNINQLGEDKYMTITVFASHENGKFQFSGLHQDIMIYRAATKRVELVETSGMWLGIVEDIDGMLKNEDIQVEVGDTVLLYTDGITEAWDKGVEIGTRKKECMFGDERLLSLLEKNGHRSTEEIKSEILNEVRKGYQTNDDITMVVLKRIE